MAGRMPFSSSEMFDPYAAIRPAYLQRPIERPTAYYFLRTLLIAGGIAGGLVALYRNDVLLELSRHVGQESRYFELERSFGVTPGWGTPRSMQPVLEGSQATAEQPVVAVAASERSVAAPSAEPAAVTAAAQSESPTRNVPVAVAIATAAAASPADVPKAKSDDALAPVSLDSLPVLPRGGRAPVAEAAPVPAERTTPSRAPTSSSKPRAVAASPEREPDAEPAPARSRKAREVEEAPARIAKAPKAAPAPERPKTEPNPHDNPLTASIRAAVRARPAKE